MLAEPHGLKSINSYRIEYNPSGIRGGDPANPRQRPNHPRGEGLARLHRALDPLQARPAEGHRQLSVADLPDHRRAAPAGRRLPVRPQRRQRFGKLTREHLPEEGGAFKYQLAILLDNLVMSAPSINSEIRDSGIIEGGGQGFKLEEVEHLIKILQAGSLPASLDPTPLQEEKVGPTLGEDSIAKGRRAIWVSMLIVPIFMIVYYRFAGVVAVVALIANMILLLGTMAFMQATFSLPGLAGLALTIGMAVDANVLVFERMREEKRTRGEPRGSRSATGSTGPG